MRRAAGFTAIVLATVTAVLLLWQFRAVLGLFVLSLAVAITLRPFIDWLVARKVPTGVALVAVYLVTIVLTVALIILITQPMVGELQRLANDLTDSYAQVMATWPHGSMIQRLAAAQLPAIDKLLQQLAGPQATILASTALGISQGLVDLISQALLVLVLSLYWSTDHVRFERLWLSLLPTEQRVRARTIWRSIEEGLGAYIRSELVQSLLAVLILSVAFTLIGVQYSVFVSVLCAVLWFIPLVGGLLVVAVVAGAGLLSGPLTAVGAVAVSLLLLVVLEWRVEPTLFNRRSYNPITTLLVMIAMTDAFGLLGLIVAPPLAVAIQISIAELTNPVMPIATGTPSVVLQPSEAQAISQLNQIRNRLATARQLLADMKEPSPRLLNMTDRLESLVSRLAPITEAEKPETNTPI